MTLELWNTFATFGTFIVIAAIITARSSSIPGGVRVKLVCTVMSAVFAVLWSRGSAAGKTVDAQAIMAALDSAAMPSVVPDFVQNERSSVRPISPSERARGVMAYYAVAINYDKTDVSLGLTYRIFRNHHAAALYAQRLSMINTSGFKPAPGFALAETRVSSPNKWPSRSPYRSALCDFFAAAASPDLATARCAALHADLPVIVSGVRIESAQFSKKGKRVTYQLRKDQKYLEYGYAMELLDTGMVRLEDIENTGR